MPKRPITGAFSRTKCHFLLYLRYFHFLLYLQYFHNDKHVDKLQVTLNQSLKATLRTSGHETAVLIETGIPPLEVTRKLQLAQFRYRLSHFPLTSLTFCMWNLWQPFVHRMNDTTLEQHMHIAVTHLDKQRLDIQAAMPISVQHAKPHNKKGRTRSFSNGKVQNDGLTDYK